MVLVTDEIGYRMRPTRTDGSAHRFPGSESTRDLMTVTRGFPTPCPLIEESKFCHPVL